MVEIPSSTAKCTNHFGSSDMRQLRTHSIFSSTLQRNCINKLPRKHFYCQDYISPQSACQTNQIDEVRVGFMQQASRWGEHDRGKPYHYDTTGDCGKSGRPSSEQDRGERGEHDRDKPYHYYMTWWTSLRSSTNKSSVLKSYAH